MSGGGPAQRSAAFADFRLYRMAIERGHLIAGFGRIVDIAGEELTTRK